MKPNYLLDSVSKSPIVAVTPLMIYTIDVIDFDPPIFEKRFDRSIYLSFKLNNYRLMKILKKNFIKINIDDSLSKAFYINKKCIDDVSISFYYCDNPVFGLESSMLVKYKGIQIKGIYFPLERYSNGIKCPNISLISEVVTVPNFEKIHELIDNTPIRVEEVAIDDTIKKIIDSTSNTFKEKFWDFYKTFLPAEGYERMKLLWEVI